MGVPTPTTLQNRPAAVSTSSPVAWRQRLLCVGYSSTVEMELFSHGTLTINIDKPWHLGVHNFHTHTHQKHPHVCWNLLDGDDL
jgi:hypothetical protein